MKNRIFASIIVLLMIASVGIAVSVNESVVNESGVNESNISNENLTIDNKTNNTNLDEIFDNTSLGKNRRNIEIMRKANVPQNVINATTISTTNAYAMYTNPQSGMSIFGQWFSNIIYTRDYSEWAEYTFYLPTAAYVYIGISGTIEYKDYTGYVLNIDYNKWSQWTSDDVCGDWQCSTGIQKSETFYLSKGYHTVYLYGYMYDLPWYDSSIGYFSETYGSISVIAIPEYTTIVVNSPNGGENWSRGATKSITWISKGSPGDNVKIELYKGSVRSAAISSKTPNDGSYSWYIPTYQPVGTDYKIKITSYEDSIYNDWSNNNFKIY